jgi:hypothetical protein
MIGGEAPDRNITRKLPIITGKHRKQLTNSSKRLKRPINQLLSRPMCWSQGHYLFQRYLEA